MKGSDIVVIITFVLLLFFITNEEVEHKQIFDETNESFFDRISPKYYEVEGIQIEKPFYERLFEIIFKGPGKLFPNVPWLGYLIVFGGGYILWLKWDILVTKIKRNIIFGKK